MNIFRQLRWQLTLSYTIVTVSAFLVITLIMGGILLTQVFIPVNYLSPELMIDAFMNKREDSPYLMWSHILSQSPVDVDLIGLYLHDPQSNIETTALFRMGALQFFVATQASIRVLILGLDGSLLGTSMPDDPAFQAAIGRPIDLDMVPGLEVPLKAALAGDTDPSHLYTILVPNQRYIMVAPIYNRTDDDPEQLVGVMAILFDALPTQGDIPAHLLNIAVRSLVIFLIGVGSMGALFGAFFTHGLTTRFRRIAATIDLWSIGDFSKYIEDATGDEISQIAHRLNNMAEQLQSLLRRRQDMAVSEERNRLARDLHDSAKQQALAASFELGTALTLFDRDLAGARKHLVEADALVDAVRKELTNLVHELRPQSIDREDFSEILKDQATEWSQRSGIEMDFDVKGSNELPLEIRETLFRIAQEALFNIARHSSAQHAEVLLEYGTTNVKMTVKDDGRGFNTHVPHDGVGLASMRERAEGLDGIFTIESVPGQGTQIIVTLPVENERR
jgi:NarL family two-component system sensor histidine kinase LiaS